MHGPRRVLLAAHLGELAIADQDAQGLPRSEAFEACRLPAQRQDLIELILTESQAIEDERQAVTAAYFDLLPHAFAFGSPR